MTVEKQSCVLVENVAQTHPTTSYFVCRNAPEGCRRPAFTNASKYRVAVAADTWSRSSMSRLTTTRLCPANAIISSSFFCFLNCIFARAKASRESAQLLDGAIGVVFSRTSAGAAPMLGSGVGSVVGSGASGGELATSAADASCWGCGSGSGGDSGSAPLRVGVMAGVNAGAGIVGVDVSLTSCSPSVPSSVVAVVSSGIWVVFYNIHCFLSKIYASAGIGEATAKLLVAKGARVVLVARSREKLAILEKALPGAVALPANMAKNADVKKMVATVEKKFGRVDAIVNNAGVGLYGPVENINLEDYASVWALNVVGPLAAMQEIIPLMRKQKPVEDGVSASEKGGTGLRGQIVNVSSMVSKNTFPYLGGYASTKYALNALSLTARVELAKDGIVVSVVHPGLTATDFGKNAVRAPGMEGMVSRERATGPNGQAMPVADAPELVAGKIIETLEAGKDAPAEVMWK